MALLSSDFQSLCFKKFAELSSVVSSCSNFLVLIVRGTWKNYPQEIAGVLRALVHRSWAQLLGSHLLILEDSVFKVPHTIKTKTRDQELTTEDNSENWKEHNF